jgi:hypothetical protein
MTNDYLDEKEQALFKSLSEDWEKFISPSNFEKSVKKIAAPIEKIIPQKIRDEFPEHVKEAMTWDTILQVMEFATKGYGVLSEQLLKYTLTKKKIEKSLSKKIGSDCEFNKICELKSYDIEACINNNKIRKQVTAVLEGGITGVFGFWGVPFNIVVSFLIYYRAVQHIALFYGYDIIEDSRELEIASEVLINSLSPNPVQAGEGVGKYMLKAMFCTEMTSLQRALIQNKSFQEMALKGGSQLFYTQIRALANKAAEKGLQKAGEKGIENVFLKKILENVGRKLPKQIAGKSIPFFGAFIGGGFDTFYMTRVIKGANIQYHKRFLIEKKARIEKYDKNVLLDSQ